MSRDRKRRSIWDEFDELFNRVWEEFEHMREDIERRISESFGRPDWSCSTRPLWDSQRRCLEPLSDVQETTESIIVTLDLPGVKDKSDISINVKENILEIEAKIKNPVRFERWGTSQKEIAFAHYYKTLPINEENIDLEKASAKFKNGILKIVLPFKKKGFKIKIE